MIFSVTTSSLALAIISYLAPSVMANPSGTGGTGGVYVSAFVPFLLLLVTRSLNYNQDIF
jgi:hypothetical protein